MKILKLVGFAVLVFVFIQLFLPWPNVANDLHYGFSEEIKSQLAFPFTWGAKGAVGMGEYAVFILWNWPVTFLFGALANIDFTYEILTKVLGFLPAIFLSYYSISKLLKFYKASFWGRSIGALFYVTNTYLILLIDGGQLNLAVAYSIFPLVFYLFKKAIDNGGWRERVYFTLSVIALSIFDIRIIYFLILSIIISFFYEAIIVKKRPFELLKNYSLTGLVTTIFLLAFHSYWIIPSFLAKAPSLPTTYERGSQVESLSFASLPHSLYLLQPHWFKNVFGKITLIKPEFFLIPILVFLAPLLKKKDKRVGFWLLLSIFSVFLVKGANPPFSSYYLWLFKNVPGFALFRDPTKFFFLVALSYSVLIAITTDEVVSRLRRFSKIFILLTALYMVFLVRPVWLGYMTGTFVKPIYQEEYLKLSESLKKDKEFGRVLWLPVKPPLGFSSITHPSLEAFRLGGKRPFAAAVTGTYELFNFLRKSYIGELLDISGVGYLAYPYPDTRREELKKDNIDYYYWFLGKLASASWAEPSDLNSKVPAIKVENHQDRFFVPGNVWLIVGSDEIYEDIYRLGAKLSNNAMVFLEENPKIVNEAERPKTSKFILSRKDTTDLVAAHFPENSFVFPAKNLDFTPDKSGWWKRETADLISWRDFLQQKYQIDNTDFDYGGGWAVGEGTKELSVSASDLTGGNVLFARLMLSSKGGSVSFYQDGERLGSINTKIEIPEKNKIKIESQEEVQTLQYDRAFVKWFRIGKIKSSQPISIGVKGDINVVNSLATISEDQLRRIEEEVENLSREGRIVYWDKLGDEEGRKLLIKTSEEIISYERISPTHYKVKVEGLKSLTVLAFSETYDSLWTMDGKRALPLYSLINGFEIEKDGEYEVVFEAQKYVFPGLVISGISFLSLLGLTLFLQRRRSG